MERNKRIKIGALVGALALAVAMPATLALANDDDGSALPSLADDIICFEVESHLFGGMEIEGMPLEGGWFEVGTPSLEGGWIDDFEGELQALPDDFLEFLNQEAADLAAHLDAAGIDYEMVDGPMGEMWVEWDFEDEAANAAVEEFFEGREDPFGMVFEGDIGFDDMAFGYESFGDLGIEFDHFGSELAFGSPVICVEAPSAQAERFSEEMAGLSAALTDAGVSYTTQTIEVEVPVWDLDDESAREVVEQYYSDLQGEGFIEFGDIDIQEFSDSDGS